MAKETVYNNTLVSGAADETLTYTRYVKDESSGKSTKELLDEKVNKTDQLGTTQIADKAVTTEKLENESVTTDKLNAASVTTDKVADANITTSKLADSSVETEKINNKAVTTDKLNDGAVDNSKLSPNAVTSEKIKNESVITEKLNDRAVTTEKVAEKAITNGKIGDSAVDGRVISGASVEKKHLANDSVATEKLQDNAVTSDKIHTDAVTEEKIKDSSVSNSKLADNSVGTSKIKDGNITNEKVANNTLTQDKLDPELRKAIQAATGLPENLVEVIQDVDVEVKSLHSKDTDLQSQITDKQQQITAHDKDIELLQTRSTQMEQTINNIAATGGASVANTVAYTNTTSGLVSVNAQGAIDELAAKNKSQDATISANASEVETKFTEESERVNGELAKKANAEDVTTQMQTEQERVNAEFAKKFDKESISQELGEDESKVVSQKCVKLIFDETNAKVSSNDTNTKNLLYSLTGEKYLAQDGYIKDNLSVGSVVDLTPQDKESGKYQHLIIPCSKDAIFTIITANGREEARLYCFVNNDFEIISVVGYTTNEVKNFQVKAPEGTRYAIFNSGEGVQLQVSVKGTIPEIKEEITNEKERAELAESKIAKKIDTFYQNEECLPSDSMFDDATELVSNNGKNIGAGKWELRYKDSNNNIVKNSDSSFTITIDNSVSGGNSGIWLLNVLSSLVGKKVSVSFYIKNDYSLYVSLNGTATKIDPHKDLTLVSIEDQIFGNSFTDNRLFFYSQTNQTFTLKSVSLLNIVSTCDILSKEIKQIEYKDNVSMPFLKAGLNSALFEDFVVNVAVFGDSWTQGVGFWSDGLITYSKYLAKKLWDIYGFAGHGWFDFGLSNNTLMGCADDEAFGYSYDSDKIRWVDKQDGNLGLCDCYPIFKENAQFSVRLKDASHPIDKAVIYYSNNTSFKYSVNDGEEVQVNANETSMWQSIEINANITKIKIVSTKDNSTIFGIDFSYGNKGIKLHKIGNRGLTTTQSLQPNAVVWKDALKKLNLSVFCCLLLTNDRVQNVEPEIVKENINALLERVDDAYDRKIDKVVITPSELKAGSYKFGIGEYNETIEEFCYNKQISFIPLDRLFGNMEQIENLGTFYDNLHPSKKGCFMIANHLVSSVFEL